jgi:hypothetical protein
VPHYPVTCTAEACYLGSLESGRAIESMLFDSFSHTHTQHTHTTRTPHTTHTITTIIHTTHHAHTRTYHRCEPALCKSVRVSVVCMCCLKYLLCVCLPLCPSVRLCLSVCMSVRLPSLSVFLSVCLSVCLSALSVRLSLLVCILVMRLPWGHRRPLLARSGFKEKLEILFSIHAIKNVV